MFPYQKTGRHPLSSPSLFRGLPLGRNFWLRPDIRLRHSTNTSEPQGNPLLIFLRITDLTFWSVNFSFNSLILRYFLLIASELDIHSRDAIP